MSKNIARPKSSKKIRQNISLKWLSTLDKNYKIVARMSKNNNIVMTYYSISSYLSSEKSKKKLSKTNFEKENIPLKDTDSENISVAKFHNLKSGESKRK